MKFQMKYLAASMLILGSSSVIAGNSDAKLDVMVKLKSNLSVTGHQSNKDNAKNLAAGMGVGAVKHAYGTAFFGFAASVTQGRLDALRNNANVASVEFDGEKSINRGKPGSGGTTPSPQVMPWGIARTGADNNSNEGAGVHVYVLDTGLDSNHADLAANIGNSMAFEQCKGKSCDTSWDDDHGHGTHVGGTIAAIDNDIDVVGMASQVTLHAGKICSSRGSCPNSSTIAALDWVTSEVQLRGEAAVVNMSIGGSGSVTGSCSNNGFTGNDAYHEAICNARNAGVVVVVAAGNDSDNAANYTPAGYADTVITVSSVKEGDDWNSFSNWGSKSASWTSNNSAPVAIAAPGGTILSLKPGGGTATMSGTSMASPHVAGAAALYLATHPQQANGSAFINTRAALLQAAENTNSFNNTSGDPHSEDFLDASNL
ncbi:S8 family serine peptidase [Pseudoalteromonas denitrificans]|uniref:Subtilase family protein n=1 Tax=Pseudoalteromonas denitrificans DSM 6059 TaxID=1123010 RepID=A0A1I1RCV1_9GAMM|nr:S8 family serine peptidase [Pseudoalteromonas denitrificans]SFD32115.1 Subtilase family protein [Pseudoalteromonas denitrificans DSM 6059]